MIKVEPQVNKLVPNIAKTNLVVRDNKPVLIQRANQVNLAVEVEQPVLIAGALQGAQGPPGPQGPQGVQGPPGEVGAGSDANYVHNQLVASAIWTIAHGLNKYPSVFVVDSGDNVVMGEIQYLDTNNIQVTFSAAFGGKAFLN